jgi:hypothetical protein
MLNPQALPIIEDIAQSIYGKVKLRLSFTDESIEQSVAEYVAHRLLNAIEWESPDIEYTRYIALHLVDEDFKYPKGTTAILKRYFDLPY